MWKISEHREAFKMHFDAREMQTFGDFKVGFCVLWCPYIK